MTGVGAAAGAAALVDGASDEEAEAPAEPGGGAFKFFGEAEPAMLLQTVLLLSKAKKQPM